MQVKKFEAPTIQEALENVKRELGPEAIILQTKNHKRGFGLMSKASVEVTAAISERSLQKKQLVESRLPPANQAILKKFSAGKQADVFDKYLDKHLEKANQTKDQVEFNSVNKGKSVAIKNSPSKKAPSAPAMATSPVAAAPKKITATRYIDIEDDQDQKKPNQNSNLDVAESHRKTMSLEEEVHYLKNMIQELKTAQEQDSANFKGTQGYPFHQTALDIPALQEAFEQLVVNGVDRRYVLTLIKKVAFELGPDRSRSHEEVLDVLASEIMDSVHVAPQLKDFGERKLAQRSVIALVGPTGVGKTTTAAKLASELHLKKSLRVGLINLDSQNVRAFDQLATFAKIIQVPFRSISSLDDLRAALQDFQSLDVVVIDTVGSSQRDLDALREAQNSLKNIPNLKTYLTISATTRDTEMYDIANRFSIFNPQGLVISKLDEATMYGSIFNLSQKVKIPFAFFTTGQTVPGDLEDATCERVAALVMEI